MSALADGNGKGRVAVVGAPTPVGGRLRDALVAAGVPGDRVDLYGTSQGEVVLSEYDGEARMIQEPALDEVARHDVVFLCEGGEVARRIATAARGDCLIVDLLDCLPAEARSRRTSGECVVVPHPLALLIVDLLAPIEREFGIGSAIAVILRPATDFGEQGVDELREQTIRLLSFSEVPTATFGRQLAFNIIPQAELADHEPHVESRIAREAAELLGWTAPRLAVRLLAAPIFHGHALQLHLRLRAEAGPQRLCDLLGEVGQVGAGATPLDADERVRVSDPAADGLGGFWIWVVAGEIAGRGAERAVQLAARRGRL
jgi:aspartate-semialdehyde dehydrogenase